MADYSIAYAKVHGNEGWYNPGIGDNGGETYAGIARNFHPEWPGWALVDAFKATRRVPRGYHIPNPQLDALVLGFYRATWNQMRGDAITSQAVANLYYDFYTNSGQATAVLQRVLVQRFGRSLVVDNAPGPATVAAINACEPAALHNALKQARIAYVQALVQNDRRQQIHLDGWLKRIASFTDQIPSAAKKVVPSPQS